MTYTDDVAGIFDGETSLTGSDPLTENDLQ